MKRIILIIFLLASTMQAQSSSSLLMELSKKKASVSKPDNLIASIGLKQIALTWNNTDTYDSIQVYRGITNDPTELLTTIGSAESYNDTNVIIGRTYYYRVKGVKSVQPSVYSSSANNYAFPDTTAYGGVIYVAKTGSDANNGSKTAPKLTMGSAQTAASAGYCIIVYSGTYYENISSTGYCYLNKGVAWYGIDGSGEHPIIRSSSTTYTVRVDGAGAILLYNFTFDGRDSSNSCYISDQSNKTVNYCTLKNAVMYSATIQGAATTANNIRNCFFTDASVKNAFYFKNLATGTNNIAGNTFSSFTTTRNFISLVTTNGGTINFTNNNLDVTASGSYSFILLSTGLNFNCQSNVINYSRYLISSSGIITGSLTFKHNIVTNTISDIEGILLTTANQDLDIAIDSNYFYMTYSIRTQPIIYLSNNDSASIKGNYFDTNSETLQSIISLKSTGNSAIKNQIVDNIFLNRSKIGYTILVGSEGTNAYDGLLDSTIISGNVCYEARYFRPSMPYDSISHHSIFVGFNKGSDVKYNKVYGSYYGIILKGDDTDSTTLIAYNLLINNYQGIRLKGVSRTNIYNNTLVNNNTELNGAYLVYLSANNITWSADSTIFKNNIMALGAGATSNRYLFIESGSNDGLNIENNLYYSELPTEGWEISGVSYSDFTAYQTSGYDANGLNNDPAFTSGSDFTLQTGSPAINAGVDVGLTQDILGNPIVGNPDIGAYEK